jgi:N-acetylmuramoyl-L-alanine amidase
MKLAAIAVIMATQVAGAFPEWRGIVIHHSASPLATTAADIDRWHRERGWDGIGYHYVVHSDGVVKIGRPIGRIGAHAKTGAKLNRNLTHIGICLVGYDDFTEAQLVNLNELLAILVRDYAITSIERHHENCPGKGLDVEALHRKFTGKEKK